MPRPCVKELVQAPRSFVVCKNKVLHPSIEQSSFGKDTQKSHIDSIGVQLRGYPGMHHHCFSRQNIIICFWIRVRLGKLVHLVVDYQEQSWKEKEVPSSPAHKLSQRREHVWFDPQSMEYVLLIKCTCRSSTKYNVGLTCNDDLLGLAKAWAIWYFWCWILDFLYTYWA